MQTLQIQFTEGGETGQSGQSQFCGGGEQTRSRECDSPAPLYGGNKCTGPAEESQDCDNEPCVPGKQLVTNNNAVTSQLVISYILFSVDYNLLCF